MQWNEIGQQIGEVMGECLTGAEARSIGGGDINSAYLLYKGALQVFVKCNSASRLAMFEAEHQALLEMAASGTVRVPHPICCGVAGNQAFIAMEYIELGASNAHSHEVLGLQLAAMHRVTAAKFGWHRNNTIGSTLQRNDYSDSWLHFWSEHRIGLQLQLLKQNGHGGRLQQLGEALLEHMPVLLAGHNPKPSMLHGDLWSGNHAFDQRGEPLIFDPAFYYGDRETDLAMTELFGGFAPRFYSAYQEVYPLDEGYAQRKQLYNLYHILNHGNLFGGGYIGQAERIMEALLD